MILVGPEHIRVIECDQGGQKWHAERAGAVTASMFHEVRKVQGGLTEQQAKYVDAIKAGNAPAEAMKIAGYKSAPRSGLIEKALNGERVGDYTSAAHDYAMRLACERISGKPLDEGAFTTYAMRRGNELEPEARLKHEQVIGTMIVHAGMVKTKDGRFGASADGLIGDNAGSEYKCLIDPARMRSIMFDNDLSDFMDQIQGCMWLTGRQWWHFVLYCPALEPAGKHLLVRHVERDDAYIEAMARDLEAFDQLVEQYRTQILETEAYIFKGGAKAPAIAGTESTQPSAKGIFTGAAA